MENTHVLFFCDCPNSRDQNLFHHTSVSFHLSRNQQLSFRLLFALRRRAG